MHMLRRHYYTIVYGCLATAELCAYAFLLFLVDGVRREKMGTFEKVIQLFRLTRVVSQFNRAHTLARTHSLACMYLLAYERTSQRASD